MFHPVAHVRNLAASLLFSTSSTQSFIQSVSVLILKLSSSVFNGPVLWTEMFVCLPQIPTLNPNAQHDGV